MKYFFTFFIICICYTSFSQVGINTIDPYASLTVDGSTAFTVVQLPDFSGDAIIGGAPDTVDVSTAVDINQTTPDVEFTMPNPTRTEPGRVVTITNSGTAAFTVYGLEVQPDSGVLYQWNGSKWLPFTTSNGSDSSANDCNLFEEEVIVPAFRPTEQVDLTGWFQTGPSPHEIITYPGTIGEPYGTIGSNNMPVTSRYTPADRYAMVMQRTPVQASDEPQISTVNAQHTYTNNSSFNGSRYIIGFSNDLTKGPVTAGAASASPVNLYIQGPTGFLYSEGRGTTNNVITGIVPGTVVGMKILTNGDVQVYKDGALTTTVAQAVTTSLNQTLYPYATHVYSTSRTRAIGLSRATSYFINYIKQSDGSWEGDEGSTYADQAALQAARPNVVPRCFKY